jgi:hypothetical protein
LIGHISDTARCVAWYRAMESRRPDAIFRDPFAERLAGPDGVSIVARMPRGRASAWAMITRMAVFDEIIMGRIREHGADLVLNLTAGLDRRMDPPDGGGPGRVQPAPPNRMPNPSSRPVSELEAPSLSFTLPIRRRRLGSSTAEPTGASAPRPPVATTPPNAPVPRV